MLERIKTDANARYLTLGLCSLLLFCAVAGLGIIHANRSLSAYADTGEFKQDEVEVISAPEYSVRSNDSMLKDKTVLVGGERFEVNNELPTVVSTSSIQMSSVPVETPVVEEVAGDATYSETEIVKQGNIERGSLGTGAEAYPALFSFDVPDIDSSFKSFEDYRCLTARSTYQWKLQQTAYTDELGFRRYPADDGSQYYMVALGTFYTGYRAGKIFRVTLDTGESFECITGDVKSDAHTDPMHQHRHNNIVEFIIDKKVISRTCQISGDMSDANEKFVGRVVAIEALGEVVFD